MDGHLVEFDSLNDQLAQFAALFVVWVGGVVGRGGRVRVGMFRCDRSRRGLWCVV